MVLHLLGKKSWNVYNHDNIDRVRKDEAEAKAREEAAEQRMQEEDAARRIAILRGEEVPALPEIQPGEQQQREHRSSRNEDYATRDRKRKRRHGEDDTDRDMRYARQDREVGEKAKQTLSIGQIKKGANVEAPLQDHSGHIQLFTPPDEKDVRARQTNEEAEADRARKRKREEDLVTMKFSNAAGYNNGMQKPWYAAEQTKPVETASRNELMLAELQGKDVWGNEDPSRKARESKRIVSSDPFAAMQNAQRQLKQSERDKQEWEKRHKAELEQLKREQRKQRKADEEDGLDGFSLDTPAEEREDDGRRSAHRHRHRRHRSHSRDRERRHRLCNRSKDREHRRRHRSRSRERERYSDHRHRDRNREQVDGS